MFVISRRWPCRGALSGLFGVIGLMPGLLLAQGEVASVEVRQVFAKPSSIDIQGETYQWGQGIDLELVSVSAGGNRFLRRQVADSVQVRRVDNTQVVGESCALFAEVGRYPLSYQPTFPGDAAGQCDLSGLLRTNIINRGLLDTFSNQDQGAMATAGNIERLDIVFRDGLLPPPDQSLLDRVGFLIVEKGGNSLLKIAAITAVDDLGNPTAFGPLKQVNAEGSTDTQALRYGVTDLVLYSDFLANAHQPPNGPPVSLDNRVVEAFGGVFVSMASLGIDPHQISYGFSLFGADVGESDDLLDPASFPLTTSPSNAPDANGNFGGDADLYGGIAAYFTAADLQTIEGLVFRDADGSGTQDQGEDGVAGVRLQLYRDNGDGRFDPQQDPFVGERTSNSKGNYLFVALPAGGYWLTLAQPEEDLPSGYQVEGAPLPKWLRLDAETGVRVDLPLFPESGSRSALLAREDRFVAMKGQPLLLDILGNDQIPAGIDVAFGVVAGPDKGALKRVGNKLVYTASSIGGDGFSYTLRGREGETSTSSVALTVLDPGTADTDRDGLADRVDPDDDNDSIPDFIEGAGDSDGDGIVDQLDPDADGDGIYDILESTLSRELLLRWDSNSDGRIDISTLVVAGIGDYRAADTDADGLPDYLDLDSDNDSIPDVIEAGLNDADFDGRADSVVRYQRPSDSDGDGIPDFRQLDSDRDGLFDIVEAGVADNDGDGQIDQPEETGNVLGDGGSRNYDLDGNGIPDFQEVTGRHLKTGVSGWGGGAFSWWFLPVLLVSGRLMRLRRHNIQ